MFVLDNCNSVPSQQLIPTPQPPSCSLSVHVLLQVPRVSGVTPLLSPHEVLTGHPRCGVGQIPQRFKVGRSPLYVQTTLCLSIHPSVDVWVASSTLLL